MAQRATTGKGKINEVAVGRKRPENCFRCWHSRRIDGMASCCVCVANMTKDNPPELILQPYSGDCHSFYDKRIEEARPYEPPTAD